MKKILIAHNYSEISFSAMSFHLANYLANIGHEVLFISHHPYSKKTKIVEVGKGRILITSWSSSKRPTGLNDYIWFTKFYFKHKPDLVIGHFVGSNISILLSKIFSFGKVNTFEYYHTLSAQIQEDVRHSFLKQNLLFIRKKIFYNLFCDVIICPSEKAKLDLKTFYKIDKSVVILNPMVDRFVKKPALSFNNIIISFLGRLDLSKGIIELLAAFEIYKKENPNSKIILNIAGNGLLANKVIEKELMLPSIKFHKSLDYAAVDHYLNLSHFVIIPSKNDNLPTVGLEALMNQTPLLISSQTGLSAYLVDGESCFKFDPNIESIVEVFRRVEENFCHNTEMQSFARNTYIKQFSIENYCENFYKLIP